jgi:hypothetical protein
MAHLVPRVSTRVQTPVRLAVMLAASTLGGACASGHSASRPDAVVVTLGEATAPAFSCRDGTPWHGACVAKTSPCIAGAAECATALTVTQAPLARYDAPPPDPAPPDTAPMAVPGPLAFACNDDAPCGTHRCNLQYGKCAFPCQSAADCMSPTQCLAGLCVPSP